jgi:hypothetical protein
MTGWPDMILDTICHRAGPDGLPLCLRCSAVYAGAGVGLLVEWVLVGLRRRPGRVDYAAAGAGVGATALLGTARVAGLFGTPDWLTVASALWFGWALAFLATWASAAELRLVHAEGRSGSMARAALLVVLVALGAGPAGHGVLRWAALPGLAAIFVAVNAAAGLVALRALRGRRWRPAAAGAVAALLAVAEGGLFALWRAVV